MPPAFQTGALPAELEQQVWSSDYNTSGSLGNCAGQPRTRGGRQVGSRLRSRRLRSSLRSSTTSPPRTPPTSFDLAIRRASSRHSAVTTQPSQIAFAAAVLRRTMCGSADCSGKNTSDSLPRQAARSIHSRMTLLTVGRRSIPPAGDVAGPLSVQSVFVSGRPPSLPGGYDTQGHRPPIPPVDRRRTRPHARRSVFANPHHPRCHHDTSGRPAPT